MVDVKVIGNTILSKTDLDTLNAAEIRSRKYKYCTIDAGEHGTYLAKVAYSESSKAWEPTHVEYDDTWLPIPEFDDTVEGGSYVCVDYRTD